MNDPKTADQITELRVKCAVAMGLSPICVPFSPNKCKLGHSGDWFTPEAAAEIRKVYPRGAPPRVIPNYPGDPAAALTLVDKLKEEGWGCVIDCEPKKNWFVHFTNENESDIIEETDPSICRAICRAFLAVKGKDV